MFTTALFPLPVGFTVQFAVCNLQIEGSQTCIPGAGAVPYITADIITSEIGLCLKWDQFRCQEIQRISTQVNKHTALDLRYSSLQAFE